MTTSMLTVTTIFYLSLIAMAFMLALKSKEIKTGNQSFLSRLCTKADRFFDIAYAKYKFAASHVNRHTLIGVVQLGAFHILSMGRSAYLFLYRLAHRNPHAKMVIDMVRGRGTMFIENEYGEMRSNAASFFLKRISEDKIIGQTVTGQARR